jgi:3-deoxy-D-manno-octulosonate 8-phosphate phosphatase (KDO 8-P phosphatase)
MRDLLKSIVVTDIDGTLTDGEVVYHDDGSRSRSFNVVDGHGVQMLQENGFTVFFMSGENDWHIKHRADKLGVTFLCAAGDKLQALLSYLFIDDLQGIEYYALGDDVNDYRLLKNAVLSATPRGSVLSTMDENLIVLTKQGGKGAFREFAEMVLESNGIELYKGVTGNDVNTF